MKLLKLAFSFFFFLSLSSCSSFNVSDTSGTFPQDSDEPSDSLSEEEENNMMFIYI